MTTSMTTKTNEPEEELIYKENVGYVPKVEPGEYEPNEGVYQE